MEVTCKTSDTLELHEITDFQGDLKTRTNEDYDKIIKSINEHGFAVPFFIWKHDGINHCLDGHGRVGALNRLVSKGEHVPPLPVVYVNCKDEADAKKLLLRINSHYGSMTAESVLNFLDGLDFDLDDLALPDGIIDLNIKAEPDETTGDEECPEANLEEEPDSVPGEMYELGGHILMCGDSTSEEDVQRLMGGIQADLVVTDPPYNVSYEGKTKEKLKIENDSMGAGDFRAFLVKAFTAFKNVLKDGAPFYIWYASCEAYNFNGACMDTGLEVRQELIWNKNSMVLGRQDYQWKHEPCQPAGTMVLTTEGVKPIEELKDGDHVVSFDTYSGAVKGYKNGGYEIKTANRMYKGKLYGINADNKLTWTTDNHQFSVRFNPETKNKYCTYLMRRGSWWRVGCTKTYDARGFGLKHRVDQEKAECAWLIDVYETMSDAQIGEQLLSTKYGIPYTYWESRMPTQYNNRTKEQIEHLYNCLDLEKMEKSAKTLLQDYGRSLFYPLITKENKSQKFSTRVTARINVCNLISNLMQDPVPRNPADTNNFEWVNIDKISTKDHDGLVYSLSVEKYEHYIADGIITHNCLYGWKEGAGHSWYSDRKQVTVIDCKRPAANKDHPTMKPVELFEYLINNSSKAGDIVLDLFGGSGTTILAAEKQHRFARIMEKDPHYCDVIRKRWTKWAKENGKETGSGALED